MPFTIERKRKLKQIAVNLTPLQYQIMKEFAACRQISFSELMRRLTEDAIDAWVKAGVIQSPNKAKSSSLS